MKRLKNWGRLSTIAREETIKAVNHGLGGIKELEYLVARITSVRNLKSMRIKMQNYKFFSKVLNLSLES
jgi:hypothetical protein